jgi:hypothetical protein
MNSLPWSANATLFVLARDATSASGTTLRELPVSTHQDTHSERLAIRWVVAPPRHRPNPAI